MAAVRRRGIEVFNASFGGDLLSGLDRWIRARFRYRPEYEEVIRTPEYMLGQLERDGYVEGDCDDISTLYASILAALGYRTRYVAIRYEADDPEYRHVFVEVFDGRGWRRVDATVPEGTQHREVERMVEYL